MVDEMKKIRTELAQHENFKAIYDYKINNNSTNPYGSFMTDVYTIYESNIIWHSMEFMKDKFKIIVQQFDGFQMLIDDTNTPYSLSVLFELKEYIKNKTGFIIDFDYKKNKSEIKMEVMEVIEVIDDDDIIEDTEEEEEKERDLLSHLAAMVE
mmetsp:Transcript_32677/g.38328  ORF Transcript_32677/g.38328 Transcript_32677/m.38328 type:complete len:153 (+) Transcript_32677:282-740(+)